MLFSDLYMYIYTDMHVPCPMVFSDMNRNLPCIGIYALSYLGGTLWMSLLCGQQMVKNARNAVVNCGKWDTNKSLLKSLSSR
jgi:hypothetical protein